MSFSRILPLGLITLGLATTGCQSTQSSSNTQVNNTHKTVSNHAGATKIIPLTKGKTLTVDLPANWTVTNTYNRGPSKYIEIQNLSVSNPPKVMMSLAFNNSSKNQLTSLSAIRRLVGISSSIFQSQAVENPIQIKKLDNNKGYYYKITDKTMSSNKAQGPNKYKYMFQGSILVKDGGVAAFSGFTNDLSRDEQPILSIFNSAKVN